MNLGEIANWTTRLTEGVVAGKRKQQIFNEAAIQ